MKEKNIQLLHARAPMNQNNLRIISRNLFNKIYDLIKNEISNNEDIKARWALTEELENESYFMIDLLHEKKCPASIKITGNNIAGYPILKNLIFSSRSKIEWVPAHFMKINFF